MSHGSFVLVDRDEVEEDGRFEGKEYGKASMRMTLRSLVERHWDGAACKDRQRHRLDSQINVGALRVENGQVVRISS